MNVHQCPLRLSILCNFGMVFEDCHVYRGHTHKHERSHTLAWLSHIFIDIVLTQLVSQLIPFVAHVVSLCVTLATNQKACKVLRGIHIEWFTYKLEVD